MQINNDLFFNQNSRLANKLLDFSTNTKPAENVTPDVNKTLPSNNIVANPSRDAEERTTVKISDEGTAVARAVRNQEQTSPNNFFTTDFSTKKTEEPQNQNTTVNNQVLDQYRFFVPTTQYEGSEGIVKRIFG